LEHLFWFSLICYTWHILYPGSVNLFRNPWLDLPECNKEMKWNEPYRPPRPVIGLALLYYKIVLTVTSSIKSKILGWNTILGLLYVMLQIKCFAHVLRNGHIKINFFPFFHLAHWIWN
jgi:hypothetical protein